MTINILPKNNFNPKDYRLYIRGEIDYKQLAPTLGDFAETIMKLGIATTALGVIGNGLRVKYTK